MFVIHCLYRENGARDRADFRVEHLKYMLDHLAITEFGIALLATDDSGPKGMMLCVRCDTLEGARAFITEEPYYRAGLFGSVEIYRARVMTPPHDPAFLREELNRQLALQQSAQEDRTPGQSYPASTSIPRASAARSEKKVA